MFVLHCSFDNVKRNKILATSATLPDLMDSRNMEVNNSNNHFSYIPNKEESYKMKKNKI